MPCFYHWCIVLLTEETSSMFSSPESNEPPRADPGKSSIGRPRSFVKVPLGAPGQLGGDRGVCSVSVSVCVLHKMC